VGTGSRDGVGMTGFPRRFGRRLTTLRVAHGLSGEQLAEAVGLDPDELEAVERGERSLSIDWLPGLAEALGVAPAELLPSATSAARGEAEQQAP
jgi:transcriptional regulator with XRE-family HTH domain